MKKTSAKTVARAIVRGVVPPFLISMGAKSFNWLTGASDPDSPLRIGTGIRYLNVNTKDADFNSIVMSVVRYAISAISEPPIIVEEEKKDDWERSPKHAAAELLRNPQKRLADRKSKTGYSQLIAGLMYSLMVDGNGYFHILLGRGKEPIGLEWIPHQFCEPVSVKGAPIILSHYEVESGGRKDNVDPEHIIHIQDGVPDPQNQLRSVSPLKSVMRLVMSDNQIAVYTHAILKHPIPSLMLTPKTGELDMEQETVDALLESLYSRAGGERAGGIAVPNLPLEVHQMGYKPDEMALDKLPRLPEERITAIYGIPAIVAGLGAGLDRSTFANFKEAREAAAEQFLVPHWTAIATALTEQLMPFFEDAGFRFAFDLKQVRILQEDEDALHARVRADFQANIYDRAVAKRKIGMDPDPAMDKGVYSFMLKSPSLPFDATAMAEGNKTRLEAEARVR